MEVGLYLFVTAPANYLVAGIFKQGEPYIEGLASKMSQENFLGPGMWRPASQVLSVVSTFGDVLGIGLIISVILACCIVAAIVGNEGAEKRQLIMIGAGVIGGGFIFSLILGLFIFYIMMFVDMFDEYNNMNLWNYRKNSRGKG